MKILETFKTALISLNSNKLRSGLTALGVVIGVFSVVTLISLGQGIQNFVTDEFDKLGSNLIFVLPGSGDFAGDPSNSFTRNQLSIKHVELIQSNLSDLIIDVSPYYYAPLIFLNTKLQTAENLHERKKDPELKLE